MSNELIINASLPETRIALLEDGEIQELLIERASGKGIVGNIYKGRVTRVLPGMQAAFVDIGLEKAAFLYVDDVYVHSELWEEEETSGGPQAIEEVHAHDAEKQNETAGADAELKKSVGSEGNLPEGVKTPSIISVQESSQTQADKKLESAELQATWADEIADNEDDDSEEEEDGDEDSGKPVEMSADPNDSSSDDQPDQKDRPEGTVAPEATVKSSKPSGEEVAGENQEKEESAEEGAESEQDSPKKRHRRGRRGGRFRRKTPGADQPEVKVAAQEQYPENYHEQVADSGKQGSDRSGLEEDQVLITPPLNTVDVGRPEAEPLSANERRIVSPVLDRPEFKAPRSRDRRIRQKTTSRPVRSQVNIQDLLKEGQEVLVQVAKDPIATKGARLTCHISLPGRHLVCMPTIDHVGVSRRIEREEERRRLREFVEKNRPRNLGFIVRTASGKQQSEKRIKQDIEYLTHLWTEIREKAANLTAPSLVYEDLNSVLRAIRDWVTEEIDKVIVDSRYHYNEILRFVSHFMPSLKQKIELYHGDIPIFDAYGISTELSRALERKVWLKSGGYIVVDQAEALVAIDVNTGRYVGKKNLEDTILKTNLEAVQEIAYQLRLRNCGGIIILDLIDMEKDENKQRVYRALEEALLRDRARPSILKISELGLIEMTRKRTRDTIVRTLCESCTFCEGKGFIKGKLTVAYEVMREIEREGIERDVGKVLVQAHPDVIDILAIDERETIDQLERRYRKLIYLQAVTDFHPEQFEVTADKKEKTERSRESSQERSHAHESGGDRNRNRNRDSDRDRDRDRDRNRSEGPSVLVLPVVENAPIIRPVLPVPNVAVQAEVIIRSGEAKSDESSLPVAVPPVPGQDGLYDEEDRLAFLRAQAAQDAALARLGNGNAHTARPPADAQNRPDRNNPGRRGVRGRRGSKFRRGNDRTTTPRERAAAPKPFGYAAGTGPKWNEGPKEAAPATPSEPTPASNKSSSGNDSGGGASSGGGGDHSQPPA